MPAPRMSKDIRDYLVTTVGLSSVSINQMSATPVDQYAVIEYPGLMPTKTHGSTGLANIAFDNTMIAVEVRNTAAQTALTNIMAVVDALDGLGPVTINGVVYTDLSLSTRPRIVRRDESGTVTYAADFRVQSRR